MTRSRARRRLPLWLPLAGAALGVALLVVRLTTVPLDQTSPWLAILVLGLAAIAVVLTLRAVARRSRRRRLAAAHPQRLILPIAVGVETAAATRWLARELGDPGLALLPERPGFLVVGAEGIRLSDGRTTSTLLPAAALTMLPLTTVKAGIGRADALAVGVTVGDAVAPLPLVPAWSGLFSWGRSADAELWEVSAQVEAALAGDQDALEWDR